MVGGFWRQRPTPTPRAPGRSVRCTASRRGAVRSRRRGRGPVPPGRGSQTEAPWWHLVLMLNTRQGPISKWSMSPPLPLGTPCRTRQPVGLEGERANFRPARGVSAPSSRAAEPATGHERRSPRSGPHRDGSPPDRRRRSPSAAPLVELGDAGRAACVGEQALQGVLPRFHREIAHWPGKSRSFALGELRGRGLLSPRRRTSPASNEARQLAEVLADGWPAAVKDPRPRRAGGLQGLL